MENITAVQLFLFVAKELNFSRAGTHLGLNGASVSKHIKNLEEELGVKLLDRTTRSVRLTEAGAAYKADAEIAMELLVNAKRKAKDINENISGDLKVNIPLYFGEHFLSKAIIGFCKAYPEINLTADFDDRKIDVINEDYDIVVRIGELKDSSLMATKIASSSLVMVANKELIEQHQLNNDISSIASAPHIGYGNDISHSIYYNKDGANSKVVIKNKFITNDTQMMLDWAKAGLGVALLPSFVAYNDLCSQNLHRLCADYNFHPHLDIHAVYKANKYQSLRNKLFIEMLKETGKTFAWQ